MTILSDFTEAKAGDWIAETFQRPTVSGGVGVFELTGTSTGYTTFGDHFSDGDVVFYAAFDDDCNRECGFAKYSTGGPVPTLTPIESNATLANGQFVDGDVKPIAFPDGGTITGTFNSEAFNAIWSHIWDKENPHEVQAFQVDQNNEALGDNVQKALDTLLDIIKAIEISEELELEVLLKMIKQLQNDVARLDAAIEQEKFWRVDGDLKLKAAIEEEISDRQDGDSELGERIDNLVTDDLADVNSASAKLDQFLIHNGVQWVAEDFHIDTELTFQGGISVPNDTAPTAVNGDLYINNEDGVAGASWTGIAGRTINAANAVGWSDKNARWYMLGDIASAAVMRVEAGLGIDVDDTKAAEPVVSIDRTEVDKWYEPPIDPKRTAFNKNFGTSSGTVAEGDHGHDSDYADVNHLHTGVYEPVFAKNTAFNKDFGTAAGQVAQGDHTHSQYIVDFTETDPTVPPHVKGITQNDINNWNSAVGGGNVDLTGYATEVWVSTNYQPKGSYLTSADLAGYATQSWVQSQNYLTSASLNGYATESWVSAYYQPKGNYALVGDSYTKAESDAKYALKGEGGSGGLPDGDWYCEGSIYAKGNITAYWTSDERKKEDIAPMPLNLIDGINPVTFKWRDSGKSSGGVIAQQLQACGLEDWVNEAPDGTLGVDYNALVGVLLAEVIDLKARVKELSNG